MQNRPIIAVVTASYNEPHKLAAWHTNYRSYRDDADLHIIVDDASEPDYRESVRQMFPDSIHLCHTTNRGLIAALNTGFTYALEAGADYIVTMLPDMRLAAHCLQDLQAALEADPHCGIVCPVLLQGGTPNIVEEAGGRVDPRRCNAVKYRVGEHWDDTWQGTQEVTFVSGGLHMMRRSVLEQVGLQDEQLFMYCDELDFDWRVRKAGYIGKVVYQARAWHEQDVTHGIRPPWVIYLWSRNRMRIMQRHGTRQDYALLIAGRCATLPLSLIGWTRRAGMRYAMAHLVGLIDGICGVAGPPKHLSRR